MKTKLVLITALLLFAFSNCSKDEKQPGDPVTSKTWKRGLSDLNPATNPQAPVLYYAVQNCEKDDTFTFGSNGLLVVDKNAEKCNQDEPRTETQSYSLNRPTMQLVIGSTTYTLAEATDKQIKYYAVVPTPSGFQHLVFLLQ